MQEQWYVLHTYSGHENKVKKYIQNLMKDPDFEGRIKETIVPIEKVVRMKNGKKFIAKKKFLPSYVMVKLQMAKDIKQAILDTPGVTNFVGSGDTPQPLAESEVRRILEQIDESKVKEASSIPLKPGDVVKVIDGPFSDFNGTVKELNSERNKVKVMVSIFGRSTPVELDVLQVEKERVTQKE